MAITLSTAFLNELRKKGQNTPCVILEIALDSGTIKLGTHTAGFTDVNPCLKSVSSLQNKIDAKTGYSTRGSLTVTITGRDNFKSLIANNYLKNRRVTRKDGFVGIVYADFASTYPGKIADWDRNGDELTLTIEDDFFDTTKKVPAENATKTQTLDYRNTNPVNIITNLLLTQLGIGGSFVNSTVFASERDTWLNGWVFDRVLTEPRETIEHINELQQETNSFVIQDGEKISYKVFAPPTPGQTIQEWRDSYEILENSLTCKGGYKDAFFNRIVVHFDYDESGSDKEDNFESVVIAADSASQGASQWNEVKSKVIKSKWIRSRTYAQPSNVTGVVLFHVSKNNGSGNGTLAYTASTQSLTWTPTGGTVGEAVKVTKDGKYQIFGADKTKWVRAVVTFASLPGGNQSDTIAITALNGETYATTLAQKHLSRYRNPVSIVKFDIDWNKVANGSNFVKPTDLFDLTTGEAQEHGEESWNQERVMLTSVRPDMASGKVQIEAIETRMYRRYCFIGPAGMPDYAGASDYQRKYYGFIGRASDNKVWDGAAYVDGYYIW